MSDPEGLKFTSSHEWVRTDGDIATIGITDHAQEELGDVALVLCPEVGRLLRAGEKLGEIESIKAVSDIYAPVSGKVIEVNDALQDHPEAVNDDPYGDGWMVRIGMTDPTELADLVDSAAYTRLLEE